MNIIKKFTSLKSYALIWKFILSHIGKIWKWTAEDVFKKGSGKNGKTIFALGAMTQLVRY